MILTYKYRVKDKHSAELRRIARGVNFVWNFCNDTQKHALQWNKKWPTGYELQKLTTGSSVIMGVSADTINATCVKYYASRKQSKRRILRYRGKKNLGWIPLTGRSIQLIDGKFRYFSKDYCVWLSRDIPVGSRICDGSSFSQDAKGRWYINVVLDIAHKAATNDNAVGIDLGLKDLATLSDGGKIIAPQFFRKSQAKLAIAQRARKRRQIKNIHIKIANQRKDFLHKATTKIVSDNRLIVIGDVSSSKLVKTRMAKSVLDASWYSLKQMLAYKSIANQAQYVEVNERFTTQVCSDCGSISGPKGRENLGIREWSCVCGASHDRDVNSAKNILRIGQNALRGAV